MISATVDSNIIRFNWLLGLPRINLRLRNSTLFLGTDSIYRLFELPEKMVSK